MEVNEKFKPWQFFIRLLNISKKRVTESKYTKIFTILVCLITLLSVILEGIIVSSSTKIYHDLSENGEGFKAATSVDLGSNAGGEINDLALGLRRLKNENVFVILFSLFQLVLGLDAVVRQSVIQLVAYTVNQIILLVFSAIQIGSTIHKEAHVKQDLPPPEDKDVTWHFRYALNHEIGLVSVLFIFLLGFLYLCWKLYKQFGWNIYKRIGADIEQQQRYKLTQIYFLFLKLDAFFQFVLCLFYVVVMTQEKYYAVLGSTKFIGYVLHVILTILLIPGLLLARRGVITENKKIMVYSAVTQCIICLDFVFILIDSAGSWFFWIVAVCLAIFLCGATVVLSIFVTRNFGKGLKPYLKRLFIDENVEIYKQSQKIGEPQNETLLNKKEWLIDDEEEYIYDIDKPAEAYKPQAI